MLVTFFTDETLGRSHLKNKGLIWVHSLGVQPIIIMRRQALQVSGHIESGVRKQREKDAEVQLASFSLFSPGPKPMCWCHSL